MSEPSASERRLAELQHRDVEALAPLWCEALPPEEALAEVRRRDGEVFRLQEVRLLIEGGRLQDAGILLEALGELPPGLDSLRRTMTAQIEAALEPIESGGALDEPYGLDSGETSGEARLSEWLERVRGWRKVLRV